MKNVIKPLAKSVSIPLGLTAAASLADAEIHKKILGSDCPLDYAQLTSSSSPYNNTILIISNDEMNDIFEIVKSLEDSSLLFQGVGETIQTEAKE